MQGEDDRASGVIRLYRSERRWPNRTIRCGLAIWAIGLGACVRTLSYADYSCAQPQPIDALDVMFEC